MTEVLTYEALKADRDAQQKRADALAVEKYADHLANSESPFASLGSARNFAIELREAK